MRSTTSPFNYLRLCGSSTKNSGSTFRLPTLPAASVSLTTLRHLPAAPWSPPAPVAPVAPAASGPAPSERALEPSMEFDSSDFRVRSAIIALVSFL